MAKLTVVFGIVLVVLGVAGFLLTGHSHPTALIPAWFGLVLCLAGALANTEESKKRMLWMHIAVTVGLLGFLFPGVRALMGLAHGKPATDPAVLEQGLMAVVCLIFVGLCVRSFIAARRARTV